MTVEQLKEFKFFRQVEEVPEDEYTESDFLYLEKLTEKYNVVGFYIPTKEDFAEGRLAFGADRELWERGTWNKPRFILVPKPKPPKVLRRYTVTVYDEPPKIGDSYLSPNGGIYSIAIRGMNDEWKYTYDKRCEVKEEEVTNE